MTNRKRNVVPCAAVLLLLSVAAAAAAQLPLFLPDGPDAAAYGSAAHYPPGSPTDFFEKEHMVGAFSHFDLLFPSHTVAAAANPWDFRRASSSPDVAYSYAGRRFSIRDYLSRMPVTGLLIAKDDQILFEAYQYGRTDRDRLTSQSMAKSIVGMLVGIAVSRHEIASIEDAAARYVPELRNTPFQQTKIVDLLHMSSGVACKPEADGGVYLSTLLHNCSRSAPEGKRFAYSAADSEVLGLVLARASHMPLSRYLDETIWSKIGTEAKATWTIDGAGQETPYCCFNAVLRDYARFGRLLAFDGAWNGKQLIPAQWVLAASTIDESNPQLAPGAASRFYGYGYQVWIFPGPRRMIALLGANGQRIFVDPRSKLVMVQTAVMEKAMDPVKDAETIHLWFALVRQLGEEP